MTLVSFLSLCVFCDHLFKYTVPVYRYSINSEIGPMNGFVTNITIIVLQMHGISAVCSKFDLHIF